MRFKTLVLIPLFAVLATGVHKANAQVVYLPKSQSQTSANAPQVKQLNKDDAEINNYLLTRNSDVASRSASRYPYASKAYNKKYAQVIMKQKYGWGKKQYNCLVNLWNRESGWRVNADNPNSSAYGIPQALPGKKMSSAGPNWKTNPHTQIKWGLKYVKGRYHTPCGAWGAFKKKGWY